MTKLKMKLFAPCWMTLCGLLLTAGASRATAQVPGPHPGYLHAIHDLREARGLLQGNFQNPSQAQVAGEAIHLIDAAIDDLKSAFSIDEKTLGPAPLPNPNLPPAGRVHKVHDLLGMAHHDADQGESNPAAMQARLRATQKIDQASAVISKAL